MTTTRTYYWEHKTDQARYLRSGNAREMASVVHRAGGDVGVIIDDGGPLEIVPVPCARTIVETSAALIAATA